MKKIVIISAVLVTLAVLAWGVVWPQGWLALLLVVPLDLVIIYDLVQDRHTILRNYPLFGHFRYVLEEFRQHVRQYFIQADSEGEPFIREQRSIVYARAKQEYQTHPFGTIADIYAEGYEWLNHSMHPCEPLDDAPRIAVGGDQCKAPYLASPLNISAMSFGSISHRAVRALNRGALAGNFFHNTGEGGLSRHHTAHGGDLVWEIGTGYFGCRREDGGFDEDEFARKAAETDAVRMVEIKLSQGAKPGGGGILPGAKVTAEIAAARGVPQGQDVRSPPKFDTFDSPIGLLQWLDKLRALSGGKPVGFKLCIGSPVEFFAVVKAMLETGILPDFITVDGAEGGTGAAELELSDHMGTPLREGLIFAHNALLGAGLRNRIRIIAAGKIIDGFDMASKIAMGADMCNAARGFMFALGCIQARVCNQNTCPTGITTLDPWRVQGLDVADKARRVELFHRDTIKAFLKVLAATGVTDPADLEPGMLNRRMSPTRVRTYCEIYEYLEPNQLLEAPQDTHYARAWERADPARFRQAGQARIMGTEPTRRRRPGQERPASR